MRKDIFIDTEIANTFAGENISEDYKSLIEWLLSEDDASLVSSKYLRTEYFSGNQDCLKVYSISHIYVELQSRGKINLIQPESIEAFKKQFFNDTTWKKLNCKRKNSCDPLHIITIFLSDRRMALIKDNAFIDDLINFPKFGKTVKAQKELDNQFDYKEYDPEHKKIKIKK